MAQSTRQPCHQRSRPSAIVVLALIILSVVLMACSSATPADLAHSSKAVSPAAPTGAPPAPAQPAESAPSSSGSSGNAPIVPVLLPGERLVAHNAQLTLQVDDVDAALQKVRGVADAFGGYVSTEHAYRSKSGDQEQLVADVSIRVRADRYEDALKSVRALATTVVSVEETSEDMTQQYVDVDANLRNLQTTESAIQKLMDRATTMNDILTVQNQLTTIRGQIERLEAQKRTLERQTSLSTITMHLQPLAGATAPGGPSWNPLATLENGWATSLTVLRGAADVTLYVVAAFWWLIIPLAGGVYVERKRRRRAAPIQAGPSNPA